MFSISNATCEYPENGFFIESKLCYTLQENGRKYVVVRTSTHFIKHPGNVANYCELLDRMPKPIKPNAGYCPCIFKKEIIDPKHLGNKITELQTQLISLTAQLSLCYAGLEDLQFSKGQLKKQMAEIQKQIASLTK